MSDPNATIDPMPPLHPDTQNTISLIGAVERLHAAQGDRGEAIAELQAIAAGRTDLLSKAAGHYAGTDHWNSPVCYRLLVDAGATDQAIIDAEAARVRANVAKGGHTTAGTQSRRWPRD